MFITVGVETGLELAKRSNGCRFWCRILLTSPIQAQRIKNQRRGHNQEQQSPSQSKRKENHEPRENINEMQELHHPAPEEPASIPVNRREQNHSEESGPEDHSAP